MAGWALSSPPFVLCMRRWHDVSANPGHKSGRQALRRCSGAGRAGHTAPGWRRPLSWSLTGVRPLCARKSLAPVGGPPCRHRISPKLSRDLRMSLRRTFFYGRAFKPPTHILALPLARRLRQHCGFNRRPQAALPIAPVVAVCSGPTCGCEAQFLAPIGGSAQIGRGGAVWVGGRRESAM
jgi:hypothetical protein